MKPGALAFCFALLTTLDAAALGVEVKDLRAAAAVITATIELRGVLPDQFKRTIDRGGVVHLRVQAEVWERRPVWDRLVYPAVVRVFRLARTPSGREFAVYDSDGVATVESSIPDPMPVAIRIGDANRLDDTARYYAKVVATLGTIAEQEIDEVGDAVFGPPEESSSLGALGRVMFKRLLQISDYLQSVSAEGVSRNLAGVQILKP